MAVIPGTNLSDRLEGYLTEIVESEPYKQVDAAYWDAQFKSMEKYPYEGGLSKSAEVDARDAYRHYTGALEGAKKAGFFPSLLAGVGHELENLWEVRKNPRNYGKAAQATYQDIINNFLGLKDYVTGNVRDPKDLYYLSDEKEIAPIVDPVAKQKEDMLLDWWGTR